MSEDDRVAFTVVVDLRTGEVVQIQGSVRVIDEPHREAIKAQVRRAALLDPRWKAPGRATDQALAVLMPHLAHA